MWIQVYNKLLCVLKLALLKCVYLQNVLLINNILLWYSQLFEIVGVNYTLVDIETKDQIFDDLAILPLFGNRHWYSLKVGREFQSQTL